MERILIAGATGSTGKRVIEILSSSRSFEPVAMVRKKEQQSIFEDMEVQSVVADLEHNDFGPILKGIDKVIFAAGSGSKTGPDKTTAVDHLGAIKLIDASKETGIRKFIMLSAMGVENPSQHPKLEHYLKAKALADDHLRQSGLPYTIVRPGRLTDDLGLGKVKVGTNISGQGEISRDDVAYLLVMSLADPLARNLVFEAVEGKEPIKEALIRLTQNQET